MEFKKNGFYNLIICIGGVNLTCACQIIEDDGMFITFIDKYNKRYSYKKALISSVRETDESELRR